MARVTVEDCVIKIPNRFELVMAASQRAREIGAGAGLMVARDNDKNPVVALREIADTDISIDNLHEALVRGHQKIIEVEETPDEVIDIMEGENEWAAVAVEAAETELGDGMHEDAGDDAADVADEAEESEEGDEAPAPGVAPEEE